MGNNPAKELRHVSLDCLTASDLQAIFQRYQKEGSMSYKKGTRFVKDFCSATGTKYNKEIARGLVMQCLLPPATKNSNSQKKIRSYRSSKKHIGTLDYEQFERLFVIVARQSGRKLSPFLSAQAEAFAALQQQLPQQSPQLAQQHGGSAANSPLIHGSPLHHYAPPNTNITTHTNDFEPRSVGFNIEDKGEQEGGYGINDLPATPTDMPKSLHQRKHSGILPEEISHSPLSNTARNLAKTTSPSVGSPLHHVRDAHIDVQSPPSPRNPPLHTDIHTSHIPNAATETHTQDNTDTHSQQSNHNVTTNTLLIETTNAKNTTTNNSFPIESSVIWLFVGLSHASSLVDPISPITFSFVIRWTLQFCAIAVCCLCSFLFLRENESGLSHIIAFFNPKKPVTETTPARGIPAELLVLGTSCFAIATWVSSHNIPGNSTLFGLIAPCVASASLAFGFSRYIDQEKHQDMAEYTRQYYNTLHVAHDLGLALGLGCGNIISAIGYSAWSILVMIVISVPLSAVIALPVALSYTKKHIVPPPTSPSPGTTQTNAPAGPPGSSRQAVQVAIVQLLVAPLLEAIVLLCVFFGVFSLVFGGTWLLMSLVLGSMVTGDLGLLLHVGARFMSLVMVSACFSYAFQARKYLDWKISPHMLFVAISVFLFATAGLTILL